MEIMGRINSGDMPPKKQPRPKADDIASVSEWIANQLREADSAQQSTSGDKVAFGKLSREEYANTHSRSAWRDVTMPPIHRGCRKIRIGRGFSASARC